MIHIINRIMKKIGIIGFSSFTKEIICNLKRPYDIFISKNYFEIIKENIKNYEKYYNCKFYTINEFNTKKYKGLITISDINIKKEIIEELPSNIEYITYIDKKVNIMDKNIEIGKGSVICSGSILTTNIKLGKFSQINLNTTIGHDTKIGNFFTSAPGVNISGKCIIGDNVYMGTNSSVKNNISICDNVIIGLNSGIVKNIDEAGTYIGTPAKKIKYD